MNLQELNNKLNQLAEQPSRENVLDFAYTLLNWMGLEPTPNQIPQLLAPKTQKLKEYLVPAPQTVQPQLYRLNAENQNIRIRFAVLKKFKKEYINQLVDNDPGAESFQNTPDALRIITRAPYFIHFVTTPEYNRLVLIFNQGDQKRVISFRNKLTNTQYNKIIQLWQDIAAKSTPEIADLLWKSLDIKEVNKEFYKQIKERFDALVGIANAAKIKADDNQIKQFAVRLIGRYIFCWFLKEKGIIPSKLIASSTIEKHKANYYKKYLLHLFFNTLNKEVQHRDAEIIKDDISSLFDVIPYLNGGLFEEHPYEESFHNLNLNDWLVVFVKALEEFDFTVDESSSTYQQIAIDPEMLGRIFENLLASQNPETEKMASQRKAFGAFYTPREIVDYMVDAALKAHVERYLLPTDTAEETTEKSEPLVDYSGDLFQPKQTMLVMEQTQQTPTDNKRKQIQAKIDKLFALNCNENPFDKNETVVAQNALRDVRVLDPACGSGAFPMGVLLRLMQLRELVGNSLSSTYELKNEILSHNIYGVDIMPMAVEISRLRAWLSLVLEVDYKPTDRRHNFGIKALPNLDFKFVCANTLIDSGYEEFLEKTKQNPTQSLMRLSGEIEKLENLRELYFDPKGDKDKKLQLREEFIATQQHIKAEFKGLRKTWNLGDFLDKVDDWNPFDDSHAASFFSPAWMFGIRDGFDVVIGNPPYVQIQKMDEQKKKELEQQNFETYERTGDLYQLFYEKGIKSLKSKGAISFITSNKWMRTNYGIGTRAFFSKNTTPIAVVDFGMALIFETATILTNILIAKKNGVSTTIPMCRVGNDYNEQSNLLNYVTTNNILIDNPNENSWIAYSKDEYELIQKIEKQGIPLKDWDISINYGIKTGCNEAFIIDKSQRDAIIAEDPKSAEIIKPILRGEDIKAYVPEFADLYLINSHNGLKSKDIKPIDVKKDYPAVFQWFSKFQAKLIKRQDKGDHWTNLRNCAYLEEFSKPKIIYPNMTKYLPFMYDETMGYVCNDKAFILSGKHLKYLTGVLNSTLWKFAFKDRFPELLGDTREVRKVFFDKIPVKKPVENYEKLFSVLVDCILAAKQAGPAADTSALEREIDRLVYRLYGLTYDEVRIVDPDFTLSREEYEG